MVGPRYVQEGFDMSGNLPALQRRFGNDESGMIAIVFGLVLIPVIGVLGVAVDIGQSLRAKAQLQTAADIAALSGARLPATANQNREQAALAAFTSNLTSSALSNVRPTITASNAQVEVTAKYEQPTGFSGVVGVKSLPVSVTAVARAQVENGGVICLLALNPTTGDGLHLQGVNKLSEQNCWAWVNSTSSSAINASGTSSGKAQGFCSAGGVSGADHFAPAPFTGCDPFEDPFAGKVAPSAGNCDATNLVLTNGAYTLLPGTYCGGLELKPQADVTFAPGVYIITDGVFEVQAQASAHGNGVVFVFTGANANLIVRGGGSVDFTAPAANAIGVGDLAGFLFFQNRFNTSSGTSTVIQGGGDVKMQGVLYMPTWRVEIGGNGEVNQNTGYWAMVADSFYMEGNGKLYLRSSADTAGLPNIMPKIPTGPLLIK
jgi:Flp pilus assembly protein TadG